MQLTLSQALEALDAGKLQWRFDKIGWRAMRRAPVQSVYPRNKTRVSVSVDTPYGSMADGLDQAELDSHPTRYRVVR